MNASNAHTRMYVANSPWTTAWFYIPLRLWFWLSIFFPKVRSFYKYHKVSLFLINFCCRWVTAGLFKHQNEWWILILKYRQNGSFKTKNKYLMHWNQLSILYPIGWIELQFERNTWISFSFSALARQLWQLHAFHKITTNSKNFWLSETSDKIVLISTSALTDVIRATITVFRYKIFSNTATPIQTYALPMYHILNPTSRLK